MKTEGSPVVYTAITSHNDPLCEPRTRRIRRRISRPDADEKAEAENGRPADAMKPGQRRGGDFAGPLNQEKRRR